MVIEAKAMNAGGDGGGCVGTRRATASSQ